MIYPEKCIVCGREEQGLCSTCKEGVHFISGNSTVKVQKSYSRLWSLAAYEGAWLEVIHKFKYGKISCAEPVVKSLLEEKFDGFEDIDLITYVPLHWFRYFKRGYNQSALAAGFVSKILSVPVGHRLLAKKRWTPQQMKLEQSQRLVQLKGAFSLKRAAAVAGKNVLLVDDVVTTGATVDECAKVLKKGGARRVDVLTLAKTL